MKRNRSKEKSSTS